MPRPESLASIQRDLWRRIARPEGAEAAAAAGDEERAQLAAMLRSPRGPSAADRIAVYANAYFARIRDCLREDFPALAEVLGEAAFCDLVRTYLRAHPPERPSLRHAGARLASHLRTPPFDAVFGARCPFAGELAALEWAIVDAFHAPDRPPLGRDALAQIPLDAWPRLRFELTPSLRLLRGAWPVHRLRERFDRGDGGGGSDLRLAPEPTQIRVWRRHEVVRHRAVDGAEADALEVAMRGESFGAICSRAAAGAGEAAASLAAAGWLTSWVADGLVVGARFAPAPG